MNDIWQTALAIIGSIGGGGIIIVGISSWLGKLWADKLMKKSEYEYQRNLELIKQDFEKKNYIHQAKFTKEFEIYGVLTESCCKMITATYALFPKHLNNIADLKSQGQVKIENASEKLKKATAACNSFVSALYYRAAFIPENLFETFMRLKNSSSWQCDFYQELVIDDWGDMDYDKIKGKYELAWKGSMKLAIDYEEVIKELRAYISSLDL